MTLIDKNFLTPKLPLSESGELEYKHIDNYADLIRQNLKHLILTIPGERTMDSDFGVGIQMYLFGNNAAAASSDIASAISRKTSKYLPFVDMQNVLVEPGEIQSSLAVRIFYSVPSLAIQENMNLTFTEDGKLIS
jgi:phage baseplate assembly protein W